MKPVGSVIYFVGKIIQINADHSFNVVMEGDDPEDIEYNVHHTNIRKLMSRRAIVVARWKRAKMVVSSIHNFQGLTMDPRQFSNRILSVSSKDAINENSESNVSV